MNEKNKHQSRSKRFKSAILDFIESRKKEKLKGKEDPEAEKKYEYTNWLTSAAKRVNQIQSVTHILKASHPDAQGSSLHVVPAELPNLNEIGSHSLGKAFSADVVGNAAALDVHKFLKIEFESRPLLAWMQAGDDDLRSALHDEPETAESWMQAFAGLIREDNQPNSHALAKQLYWLVGEEPTEDEQFHLLQPLFASSLTHTVHHEIQDARFGDENVAARRAKRNKETHESPYRDYPNLIARKLGGTKPQNISQLNSERGGINYLLSSSPPHWDSTRRFKVLNVDSVMPSFSRFDDVPELLKRLKKLLKSDPDSTMEIRDRRDQLVKALGQQLGLFGAELRSNQEPGWTRNSDCALAFEEQLWLDPERTELPLRQDDEGAADEEFNAAYHLGDWPNAIATRFGAWLNARLRKAGLVTMGDAELKEWASNSIIDTQWPVPINRRPQRSTA